MDRPVTISEYHCWLQLICAESAVCSRAFVQLTEKVEKFAALKETLVHKIHQKKQKVMQLEEEIGEAENTAKQVRECITEVEAKLVKLTEENDQLKHAESEQGMALEKALKRLATSEDRLEELENEWSKLRFLKRYLNESVTVDTVWDTLPDLLTHDTMKKAIEAAASNHAWEELLNS